MTFIPYPSRWITAKELVPASFSGAMTEETFFLIIRILFIVLSLSTMILVSSIILTLIVYRKTHFRSITHLLTCNSLVAILYHSMATIAEVFISTSNGHRDSRFCRICAAIYLSSCVSITYSYFVQALSRYFITNLYQHKVLLTFRTNRILIVASWLVAGALPALLFASPSAYQYEDESHMCFLTTKVFDSSFLAMLIGFCVPLVTIIVLYGLILRQATRTNQLNNLFSVTAIRMKRNVKVFKKIVVFVLIMSVGGLPYLSTIFVNRFAAAPRPLYSISILFISLSTVLESLVCLLTNKQVKTFLLIKMKCHASHTVSEMRLAAMRNNQALPQTHRTAHQLWASRGIWCQNISERRLLKEWKCHIRSRLSSGFIFEERKNLIRCGLNHGHLSSSHQEFTNETTFDEFTELWRESGATFSLLRFCVLYLWSSCDEFDERTLVGDARSGKCSSLNRICYCWTLWAMLTAIEILLVRWFHWNSDRTVGQRLNVRRIHWSPPHCSQRPERLNR